MKNKYLLHRLKNKAKPKASHNAICFIGKISHLSGCFKSATNRGVIFATKIEQIIIDRLAPTLN
jgi:hypothetical protein